MSLLASAASGLSTALAGGHWWAVVLVVCLVLGSTYGMVYLLTKDPRVRRITTLLITVEAEEPPRGQATTNSENVARLLGYRCSLPPFDSGQGRGEQ